MSNENKRTPLEESLNLPSMEDLNGTFNGETVDKSEDNTDVDSDEGFLADFESFGWDEEDMNVDPEELKRQIAKTQDQLARLKDQDRQAKHLKRYHTDVDEIHSSAMEKFEEIMSVALTMEAAAGSKYLASATKLLDIALSAKNAGMDREIEMAKLQLRKEKQDYEMNRKNPRDIEGSHNSEDEDGEDDVQGSGNGEAFDRNALVSSFSEDDS